MKKTWQSQFLTSCGVMSGDAPNLHMVKLIAGGIPASLESYRRLGSPCRRTPPTRMCRGVEPDTLFFPTPAAAWQEHQVGSIGPKASSS